MHSGIIFSFKTEIFPESRLLRKIKKQFKASSSLNLGHLSYIRVGKQNLTFVKHKFKNEND
jgi:hypothetical protein